MAICLREALLSTQHSALVTCRYPALSTRHLSYPPAESHVCAMGLLADVRVVRSAYLAHRRRFDMPSNDVITLDGVNKTYRLGRIRVRALADVNLTITRGDFIALAGPSGSGKTTLLNLIGCIDKPDSGRIVVDDADVTPVPLHRLAALRRNTLGFIFQTFNLIP